MPQSPGEWLIFGGVLALTLVLFFAVVGWLFRVALGRGRRRDAAGADEFAAQSPRGGAENPAFMAASVQAVIARLREQEKELERLHRAEKGRAEQTERLSEAVTRDMPTGLVLVNTAGLISLANPAARVVLGVEALAFRRYTEALGPDSRLTELITACLTEARTFQREETDHVTPGGEPRHLGVAISPVFQPPGDPRGKVTGAVCLLSDLTEMSALQRQVRLKENLAALGEMSAGIAHEFKNALATIAGYAQMIQSEAGKPEVSENAARILEQTRALSHVVTEFLRFARPLDVATDEVALDALMARVREEAAGAMPDVTFATEGAFTACAGDEGLLRQAFLNLARNAGEAVRSQGAAGRVLIRGEVEEPAGRALQRITFADNGPGIKETDLPRIFLPFYTTKADGTGLGLALVQKIIVHHGGAVEARNAPTGGAEVIVTLPARPAPPAGD